MITPGVEKVVRALQVYGYVPMPSPFEVAFVPFWFASTLIGPARTLDLVVVVDTVAEAYANVRRQVTALARALDVVDSRRTLTVVLVGPRPDNETLVGLGEHCRTLPVGTVTQGDEQDLRDWLRMFSPLEIPQPTQAVAEPLEELRQRGTEIVDGNLLARLTAAAQRSKQDVENALAGLVKETLAPDPHQ